MGALCNRAIGGGLMKSRACVFCGDKNQKRRDSQGAISRGTVVARPNSIEMPAGLREETETKLG